MSPIRQQPNPFWVLEQTRPLRVYKLRPLQKKLDPIPPVYGQQQNTTPITEEKTTTHNIKKHKQTQPSNTLAR